MIWTWILMCVHLAIAESVTLNTPFMGDFVIEEDGKGKRAVIFVHGENETGAHMARLLISLHLVNFGRFILTSLVQGNVQMKMRCIHLCIWKCRPSSSIFEQMVCEMYSVSGLDLGRFCVCRRYLKRPHCLRLASSTLYTPSSIKASLATLMPTPKCIPYL